MPKFITARELNRQWARVLSEGWLPYFKEAAAESGESVENLIAIGSRETNLDPKWLKRLGDEGNGAGLLQIDKRSYPAFVSSGEWKDARAGILKGADVLAEKRDWLVRHAGTKQKVKQYTFTVPTLTGVAQTRCAVAMYNCGAWAAYHVSKGRDPDRGTTDANYSADVLERAGAFKKLLDAHEPELNGTTEPTPPEPATAAVSTVTETKTETTAAGPGLLEKVTSTATSIASNQTAKDIASAGVTKLGTTLTGSAATGSGTSIITGIATGKTVLIVLGFVLLLIAAGFGGYLLWHKHKKEMKAADIAADKSKDDISFMK